MCRRRTGGEWPLDARSWSFRCTATWRRRLGGGPRPRRGCRSATCRRPAARCPGSLCRDVAELRERGLLCGHVTAAPAYGGEEEALSVAGALDAAAAARLGGGRRRPGAGDHRLRDAARARRDRGARHGPCGARPRYADPVLSAPLRSRPPRPPPRRQPPHAHRDASCSSAGSRSRSRPGEAEQSPALQEAAGWRHRVARPPPTSPAMRPPACRPGPWAAGSKRTACSSPRLRWAGRALAPCAGRDTEASHGRGATHRRHGDGGQAARHGAASARPTPRRAARFEGLVLDFLSYLELERGLSRNTLNAYRTDLLQYGEFLAAHEADALAVGPADVADFLADLATGNGRPAARPRPSTARPPACAPSTSTCAARS